MLVIADQFNTLIQYSKVIRPRGESPPCLHSFVKPLSTTDNLFSHIAVVKSKVATARRLKQN